MSPHKEHRFQAEGDLVERLEGESRRRRIPLDEILPRLRLSSSDSIVDLGSGTGYFTFPIARIASEVLGVDIEDKMLKIIRQRMLDGGIDNVHIARGDMNHLPIVGSSADHVLAAFVYHEVADQAALLAECARILKRGGKLTVIDFPRKIEREGPPVWVRKSPSHVKRTAMKHFSLVSSSTGKSYYQLTFSKN